MSDNQDKSIHGSKGKEQLYELLEDYKDKGYIREYQPSYKTGYSGKKKDQFFFQAIVAVEDEKWILQSTTSVRTDRINIQQWNALHMKELNDDITRAIVVYPDSISEAERKMCKRYNDQISKGEIFSAIDDILSLSELDLLLEKKALQDLDTGAIKATLGINLEERITKILKNENNIRKWNGDDPHEVGYLYPYFVRLMQLFEIDDSKRIVNLSATNQIPSLPSRGRPKTDVAVTIRLIGSQQPLLFTMSLKRTSAEWVSVHEYNVQQFIDVLGITDSELKAALFKFQDVGNARDLDDNTKYVLQSKMSQYNIPLSNWVYGGIGGEANELQKAQYMIVYKNEDSDLEMWKLSEYIEEILKVEGHFGTPFKWTYPSKKRGKSIQLKGKIL